MLLAHIDMLIDTKIMTHRDMLTHTYMLNNTDCLRRGSAIELCLSSAQFWMEIRKMIIAKIDQMVY